MNTTNLTTDTIHRYIPNILAEVDGETPLFSKLEPFINAAKIWLEQHFLGSDDFLSTAHNEYALRILVVKAFADALPSLDIVVTPTGLAVIHTDNLVPASKDRTGRLLESLQSYLRANIAILVDCCRSYEAWRKSDIGAYFCSSFLSSLLDHQNSALKDESFEIFHHEACAIEHELSDRYLGRKLTKELRDGYNSGSISKVHPIVELVRSAIFRLIDFKKKGLFTNNTLWLLARPILNELNEYPDYRQIWFDDIGRKFEVQGFVNDIKGAFYF